MQFSYRRLDDYRTDESVTTVVPKACDKCRSKV